MRAAALAGRLAVVTGGGSGIGAACCLEFVSQGARLVVADRNLDAARAIAAELGGSSYEIDVADEESAEACARRIEADQGPVGMLVHCAGVV